MTLCATGYSSLLEWADRMWEAAWELDELRGNTDASEWTARKVRDLIRRGRADEPSELAQITHALEERVRGSK